MKALLSAADSCPIRIALSGAARLTVLSAVLLAACAPPPTAVAPGAALPTPAPVLPTATPLPPTLAPTPPPTPLPLDVTAYWHPSGVFAMNLPDRWEVLDESTDQRLLVRLLPPPGYGSRVTVDITHEGPLTAQQTRELAESYIRLHYEQVPGYREVSRADLPDGRLQVVFLYDDLQGAIGRETLIVQQVGPYFAALRLFLSDRDIGSLGLALDGLAASILVDPLAGWGTVVAAINPAELLIDHTLLWRDRQGVTYLGGELYNASPADITDVQVAATLCDEAGIVVSEVAAPTALFIVPRESATPFGLSVENLPADLTICSLQASARPAAPDPGYTTAAVLDAQVQYNQWRRDLKFSGPLTNIGLVPIDRIEVTLVVYDATDQVIAYQHLPLDSTLRLEPGQSTAFESVIPVLGGAPDHVVTLVQARYVQQQNYSLNATDSP